MDQPITGFHQDEEGVWVAELGCGHQQHVRHDPPWQVRPWVTSPEGRAGRIGTLIDCRSCDEDQKCREAAWFEARLQGLCHEGAMEVAMGRERFRRRRGELGPKE